MAEYYQRKPNAKEAAYAVNRLTKENAYAVALWCHGDVIEEIDPFDSTKTYAGINFDTLHGRVRASEGDYIIQGPLKDFWPCKPSQFHATYEPWVTTDI